MSAQVTVIGAGLAGVEAAWRLAENGVQVTLCEMRPQKSTPAHQTAEFAELICSNSLKAERLNSAAGLLKAEMRELGSLTVETAYRTRVPAGGALAVDRNLFSAEITQKILAHPNITVRYGEVTALPDGVCIVAAGPLMSDALAQSVQQLFGQDYLNFFDAAAPIVTADSIDLEHCFAASRYDRGGEDDYLNCPMNKEQYEAFHAALVSAERAPVHGVDEQLPKTVYEGCMPVEIMASRGADTLRFGPLKPVGLRDPKTGHRPWAVVQLRKENSEGTLYNLVGFQTNLKFGEQQRVFSMIPALQNAVFSRYGVMHRNTFLCSPKVLTRHLNAVCRPDLFFAGQMTGVEGYMESAASGIVAAENALRYLQGRAPLELPATTMLGALTNYLQEGSCVDFQPMGANFGILPALETPIRDKQQRYQALAERAMADLKIALS